MICYLGLLLFSYSYSSYDNNCDNSIVKPIVGVLASWDCIQLTHWSRVTHIWVSELCHHCLRWCFVDWSTPSHHLKQYWDTVNWTLGEKLSWNSDQNMEIFIHEKAFDNVVCENLTILSRPQCVIRENQWRNRISARWLSLIYSCFLWSNHSYKLESVRTTSIETKKQTFIWNGNIRMTSMETESAWVLTASFEENIHIA